MLELELEDVLGVLSMLAPYLIGLGVALLALALVMVFVRKLPKLHKQYIRRVSGIVMGIALLLSVNLMTFGPLSTLIDLTQSTSEGLTKESIEQAEKTATEIAEEGYVLLKNEQNLLPLQDAAKKKLSLFGYRSAHPLYGGAGSGGINDLYDIVSLKSGLEQAGFTVDETLYKFFEEYSGDTKVTISNQKWDIPEPAVSTYGNIISQAKANGSSTAVIVLARMAGEGHNDMPMDVSKCATFNMHRNSQDYNEFEPGEHYLELTHTEKDMIAEVCKNYDDVIVIYNGANPMEMGFVDEYRQIKSVIWAPGAGNFGFTALGEIMAGTINPSGKTTDTFPYDLKQSPWWNNGALRNYSNMTHMAVDGKNAGVDQKYYPSFVNYTEGIYVGYKYWETAAAEQIIDYDACVQYPFGYGLSYTTFSQEMSDLQKAGNELKFSVTVTNTGDVAGKETVEIFFNPPYLNGGIEKASANLIQTGKTKTLAAGESEKLSFVIDIEDLASYDYLNEKAYVLDAGDYVISCNSSSHTVLDSKIFSVDKKIVYKGNDKRESDAVVATNHLDEVNGGLTYLSRKDRFSNLSVATAAPLTDVMSDTLIAQYHLNANYDPNKYVNPSDKMPVTGAKNEVMLKDLRGKAYDDPLWNDLLDKLTVDDMDNLTAMGGYQTAEIASIGKVKTGDFDGPAAINNNFTGEGSLGFPIEVVIANTFNQKLAYQYGQSMGQMNRELGGHGWYAPGVNMHRTPFTGRNYEYFSEDATLAGLMSANAIAGAETKGIYSYVKHFALYDFNGKMTCVWANEQAIREIYLKPFEIAIKDGGADAIMVSWSFAGIKWVGECSALLKDIVRTEWAFNGLIETDFFRNNGHGFMNADIALPNGVDCMLSTYSGPQNHVTDKNAASNVIYMREACHHILYTTVNSWAYESEDIKIAMSAWKTAEIVLDVILGLAAVGGITALTYFYVKALKRS